MHAAPDTDLKPVLAQALAASSAHQTAVALALLQQAIHNWPNDFTAWYLYAAENASAGDFDKALAAFTRCHDLDPDDEISRFQHALLLLTLEKEPEALALLPPLLTLAEGHYLNRFAHALQLIASFRVAEAEPFLRQGLAANAALPDLNRDMTLVLQRVLAITNAGEAAHAQAAHGTTLDAVPALPRSVLIRGYGLHGSH